MDYEALYKSKLTTAEEAAKVVKSGDWVDYGWTATTPVAFDAALAPRMSELTNVNFRGGILMWVPEIFKIENPSEFDKFVGQILINMRARAKSSRMMENIKKKLTEDFSIINKAKGLYDYLELVGGKYEDMITVGDNINDTHMIKEFRSYAMANGVQSIKDIADYVTEGITELIEKEMN